MIEYKIKDPAFFIKSIKSISTILDESTLQFDGRIRMYGVDPAGICLFEFILGENELDIISDEKTTITVCIPDLQKILNRFRSPDELLLLFDDNMITIKGKIDNRTKTFKLGILDIDVSYPALSNLAKLNLDSVFSIDMSDFLNMIEDAEINSEEYTIETINDEVSIISQGTIGSTKSTIRLDNETTSDEKCSYSVSYTKNILKALGSDDAIVSFAKDMPLMIYNKLSVDSFIKWYLGPRVVQDD